jgi:integrase/recombinase XerD
MGEHRIPGPLSPCAGGFEGELARLGFTPRSARYQVRLAADLSGWLADAGLDTAGLTDAVVGEYAAVRRAEGMKYRTPAAFRPLLGYLRRLGVSPGPAPAVPATPAEALLEEFRAWLLSERGVTPAVARGYRDLVRPFAERHAAGGLAGLNALTAGDVTAFLTAQARRLAPKTAQRAATALRSLLRFCHLRGLAPGHLGQAVPTVANRRPGLPRPLEPGQVRAMMDACDPATAAGRRDLAMLTLMARMGLRAAEVAGLRLDDITWRSGEITVRGKGGRLDRLPLTADAGDALAAWLQDGRPAMALDRAVFTRLKAPRRGLTATGVTMAVSAAAGRAGLGTVHAHRLRHSAATAILAGGGSLAEIGQVLRHQRPATTAIYVKADIEALRSLARPWPGAAS